MTKHNWKYLIILLMTALMAWGLVACGGSEDKPVAGYPAGTAGAEEEAGGFNTDGITGDVGGNTDGTSLGEPGEGVTDGENAGGTGSGDGDDDDDLESAPGAVTTAQARPTEDPNKGAVMNDLESVGGGYTWHRQGGIAGFCDIVTVLAGTATVTNCGAEPPEIVREITLTLEQSQQVNTWLEELAPFEHEEGNEPGVADGMSIVLTFFGKGDDEPSDDDLEMMEALAIDVLQDETSQAP